MSPRTRRAPGPGPAGPTALPRLVLVTDRSQLPPGRDLVGTIAECASAGLGAVIVREHDLRPATRRALVAALAELAGLVVVSSRLADPAAHGLHLAAHQEPEQLGESAGPWGRSCHSRSEVVAVRRAGGRWATLSPFACSASKPGYGPAVPRTAYRGLPLPVLALGGIGIDNARQALEAGAHGVAVMGEVMRAADPAGVVARLLEVTR
ncbi:thiamine phosphate synthase [Nocardioides sp. 616]|uniref:thiamine phosphate synthase n=1 Tax=Nocardioides sp. 616 TaxID=2268090 RepID=UPI000CE54E2A|nr:thiamine phosphate synthase [Nocardioides sp. 616]